MFFWGVVDVVLIEGGYVGVGENFGGGGGGGGGGGVGVG